MNELTTKLYKVDWDFIKKNYLNQELWTKEWVLLEYDTLTVSMVLQSIEVYLGNITMRIKVNLEGHSDLDFIYLYDRDEMSNEGYTKSLVRRVQDLIEDISRKHVRRSDLYLSKKAELVNFEYEVREAVYTEVEHLYNELPEIIRNEIYLNELIEDIVRSKTKFEWQELKKFEKDMAKASFRKERAMVDLIIGGNKDTEFIGNLDEVEVPKYELLNMEETLEIVESEVREGFEY